MSLLEELDPVALTHVRKKGNLVSIYDMLHFVTGQGDACRKIWQRLLETQPERVAICHAVQFTGRAHSRPQETPATDARGVVLILMALPGQAARQFRMKAADVLVRYLGGDPALVTEVWRNREAQQVLADECPQHPARIFGEAVEAESVFPPISDSEDLEERLLRAQIDKEGAETTALQAQTKLTRIQAAEIACRMCEKLGFSQNPRYIDLQREAVNEALLPPGQRLDGQIDAAAFLILHGHSESEVRRLAPEFGKLPKAARLKLRGATDTTTQDYGLAEREIYTYSRQGDREFLASCYKEFQEKHVTWQNVMNPDPAKRLEVAAALEGARGMRRRSSFTPGMY